MDEKQSANIFKIFLILTIISYSYSIFNDLLFIIKNYSTLTLKGTLFLFPYLILSIYLLYRFVNIMLNNFNKTDSEVNSVFKEIKEKNLNFVANIPSNIFGYFKYNKNKLNSTEFLFFGNGKLNLFFSILFISFLLYNSKSNREIINNLINIAFFSFIIFPIVLFSSKITAKSELKFKKELEEKEKNGIKPGIMDELTWKSLLIILIITPLIIALFVTIFILILNFFA